MVHEKYLKIKVFRSIDLSLLVASKSLGMAKKSKSSDICRCVCIVLVHQPGNVGWVISKVQKTFAIFGSTWTRFC